MIDELPSCYGHELRKARKDHKCCECRGVIPKGETYHFHHGVWDGRGESFKECVDCCALRQELNQTAEYADEYVYFTGLYEHVFEGGVKANMERFIKIKETRKAPVPQWMRDRLEGNEL